MNTETEKIVKEIGKVVKGKERIVRKVVAAILAQGHVLLEDIPGVGKTTLALALAGTMDLKYRRMQFTPDVLPSDIVGFMMYNSGTRAFEYREGAIFCNLFLADEINRTSAKTQSALLEAMEEGKVTVEGQTYRLPAPFCVIATENPVGSSGTQLLPESQLDRFLIQLSMGYPSADAAVEILKNSARPILQEIQSVITVERLQELQQMTADMYVDDKLYEYIVKLTELTRHDERIRLGVSPRGSIALLKMAKATALMRGGEYVIPEDVLDVIADTWAHRIRLSSKAKAEGLNTTQVIMELSERISTIG
ncbi:MAG: MoxR family ATPase [Lachnospiraceae bacterium]|nr:MoxR family ATPase [Lachnospiraceae bacterium]